jgi:uncharacterized protein (TIGR00369 family)
MADVTEHPETAAVDSSIPLQAHVFCPVDVVFGLTKRGPAGRDRVTSLAPGASALGHDDLPAAGLAFLLADVVVGSGVMAVVRQGEVLVTTNLHIELHERPFASAPVQVGIPGEAFRYHGGGTATGVFREEGRTVATAVGRFAVLDVTNRAAGSIGEDRPPMTDPAAMPPYDAAAWQQPSPGEHPLVARPVHRALGARLDELGTDHVRVSYVAAPHLANERHGLHGGSGALMGERTAEVLLRALAPAGVELRPVSLSATYLRPIAADGAEVVCEARALHVGRGLASVRSTVFTPAGRPSVVVDVVAAGAPVG